MAGGARPAASRRRRSAKWHLPSKARRNSVIRTPGTRNRGRRRAPPAASRLPKERRIERVPDRGRNPGALRRAERRDAVEASVREQARDGIGRSEPRAVGGPTRIALVVRVIDRAAIGRLIATAGTSGRMGVEEVIGATGVEASGMRPPAPLRRQLTDSEAETRMIPQAGSGAEVEEGTSAQIGSRRAPSGTGRPRRPGPAPGTPPGTSGVRGTADHGPGRGSAQVATRGTPPGATDARRALRSTGVRMTPRATTRVAIGTRGRAVEVFSTTRPRAAGRGASGTGRPRGGPATMTGRTPVHRSRRRDSAAAPNGSRNVGTPRGVRICGMAGRMPCARGGGRPIGRGMATPGDGGPIAVRRRTDETAVTGGRAG